MQGPSLYWFAAKQETGTRTQQKFSSFYGSFTTEFNEIRLFF